MSKTKEYPKKLFIFETDKFLNSRPQVQQFFAEHPSMKDMPYLAFGGYIHRWQNTYNYQEVPDVKDFNSGDYRPQVGAPFFLPFITGLILIKDDDPKGVYDLDHAGLPICLGDNPQKVIQKQLNYWIKRTLEEYGYWEGRFPSFGAVTVNHPEFTPSVEQSAKNLGLEYRVIT